MRASRLVPLFVAAGLVTAIGHASADDRRQRPAGGTGNRLIVRALTSAGQPVTDLKAEEVSVRIDGKPREVRNLELVSAGVAGPAATVTAAAPATLPAPFATNAVPAAAPPGGREFLVILDEEGIGPGREEPVRKAFAQLVSNALPADRFGLISLRLGGIEIQPSTQSSLVTDALATIGGGGSPNETVGDMVCRAKRGFQTLVGALRSSQAGRTIVLLSPGLPASPAGIQLMAPARQDRPSELCQIRSTDFDELANAAAASPANVYVLHYPDGLAATASVSIAQQGLENVAGTVNGEFFRLSGGNEASIGRIATETTSYYLVTLDDGAGAGRRIEVRSTRDGLRILARPAGTGSPAAAAVKAGTPKDMIRVATVFRELPLRAAGFVSRQPGANDLKVVALFEPEDPAAKLTAALVGLFDEKGSLKAQWTALPAELARSPIVAALTAAPGRYRLRVAATDATGKAGTTDYDLAVELPDFPPVKVSTMLLGVGQGGFAPRLAFTSADAAAIGFIEIYGAAKDAKIDTTFEIVKPDGEIMGTGQGTVGPGQGPDARIAYGGFGIATLDPGDYTMRATVSVDGKQAGVATRTLRKLK